MPNQMTCPCCNTLDLRLKLDNGICTICGNTRSINEDKLTAFMELADNLYHHTQIPHQYFELGNLFLRNVSLTEEPDRNQVFVVYRKQADGGFAQIEILTVNSKSPEAVCAALLRCDNLHVEQFAENIRIYDDQVTAEELEAFKKRFDAFALTY
jgi:hypothetical protein